MVSNINNRKVAPNNVNDDLFNEKIPFREVLVINADGEQLWALINGLLAQLAEQLTLNQWVWGSNPQESTIYVYKSIESTLFF